MTEMLIVIAPTEAAVRALATARGAQIKGRVHRFDSLGSSADPPGWGGTIDLGEQGYVALAEVI